MHLSPPGNQALKLTAARVIESTSISEESPWSRQNWDTLRWSRVDFRDIICNDDVHPW